MVILQAIQDFGNWFWGIPILILIGGGGLFLTIYLAIWASPRSATSATP